MQQAWPVSMAPAGTSGHFRVQLLRLSARPGQMASSAAATSAQQIPDDIAAACFVDLLQVCLACCCVHVPLKLPFAHAVRLCLLLRQSDSVNRRSCQHSSTGLAVSFIYYTLISGSTSLGTRFCVWPHNNKRPLDNPNQGRESLKRSDSFSLALVGTGKRGFGIKIAEASTAYIGKRMNQKQEYQGH